ncbi:MAG TPA: DoxX family membrane protein, partial [Candidatus Nanoarchaeia archaeon]|nr:DoxX family membrane protein [Candidatus Nanoarchaeia archaeon]
MIHGVPKLRKQGGWLLLGIAETLGGLAVIIGFLTQLAGLGLALTMVGAIYMKT